MRERAGQRFAAMPRRLGQLYIGLVLHGVSMALMVRSHLGVMPWDVLHQGLARQLGWSMGLVTIVVGALVLVAWIPLRQRPGIGTVSNIVVVGLALDGALAGLPAPEGLPLRLGLAVGGVLLNAIATASYIGVHFGPGPRDGLMTGLVARTGGSVRLVRSAIEVVVVAIGFLLGGTVGLTTALYALGIGPLVHALLPRLSVDPPVPHVRADGVMRPGPVGPPVPAEKEVAELHVPLDVEPRFGRRAPAPASRPTRPIVGTPDQCE